MASPARSGARPTTSVSGPQRQLSQQATPQLWGLLVHRVFSIPGVEEGHSQVSPASSRAVLLTDHHVATDPTTSLASEPPLEPVHLHGVTDTSLHLCLPPERAAAVCRLGWAQMHQYGDHGTEVLVYGPRDEHELAVVVGLVEESLAFARHPGPR